MRESVSAGWVEKLVESWLRFQNNYRHSVIYKIGKQKQIYREICPIRGPPALL